MGKKFDHQAEFKKFNVRLSDLKRNIVKYRIGNDIYEFGVVDPYEDVMDGYCFKTKRWAWLYDNCVWIKDGRAVNAERIC